MSHTKAEPTVRGDSDLIECKVVKILSSDSVVLNAGKSIGVRANMVFYIYGYEVIREPESNIEIETLEYIKARVKVSLSGEKVCVADTFYSLPSAKWSDILHATTPKWHEDVKVGDIAKQQVERK